jgi:hypothetical protein
MLVVGSCDLVDEFGRSCYPVTSSRIREIGPSFTQAVTPHGMGEVPVSQPHLPSLRQLGDQSQGLADLRDRSDGCDPVRVATKPIDIRKERRGPWPALMLEE